MPGMLFGRIVRAQMPSAMLLGVDVSEAAKVPGVVAVLTSVDVPHNDLAEESSGLGMNSVVMPVLAREAYGSAADLGLMYGVSGGAGLLGALAYGAVGHRLPRRMTFVGCFAVVPLVYLVLATFPPLPAALVAIAVVGFAAGPLNPLLLTVASYNIHGGVGVDRRRDLDRDDRVALAVPPSLRHRHLLLAAQVGRGD